MAEGETQRSVRDDSFSRASGEADECFCEPCMHAGKWVAVEGYCQVCQEYLCENCLSVHRNQELTRGHTIIDKGQMPRGDGAGAITDSNFCTDVCTKHPPELIRFYCKNHDIPGCVDCMTLDHGNCHKERVRDISQGFRATGEFKYMQLKLDQLIRDINRLSTMINTDLQNLDKTYHQINADITTFRQQVNAHLDKIQKQITDEVKQIKKVEESELKRLKGENESLKSELENLKQRMETKTNISSVFLLTKQLKGRPVPFDRIISKMANSLKNLPQHQNLTFVPSTKFIPDQFTHLGTLSGKPDINMKASYEDCLTAQIPTDTNVCQITDCALIDSDRLVIIDKGNRKVKLLDISSKRVISSYGTSHELWGVTAVGQYQVAVTKSNKGEIDILNANPMLNLEHQIKVNQNCQSIAYKDEKFAVSYVEPGKVEILDVKGQVLHSIQPKVKSQGQGSVPLRPYHITFGLVKDTVIVSDSNTQSIVVVTFGGDVLLSYKSNTLSGPRGVATSPDDFLFVANRWGHSIHIIWLPFMTERTIIKDDKQIVKPAGICHCSVSNRLYISTISPVASMANTIKVYQLKS